MSYLDTPDESSLYEADRAAMGHVATDAAAISAAGLDVLRSHGLSDRDIFQAAARCFFSTVLDAVGTEPDVQFRTSLDPALRESLTFGRPVAEA
jgi:hypothetical protein